MADYIPNKMVKLYHKALDREFGIYNNAGFNVTQIESDQEFQPMLDPIKRTLQVNTNYASAEEHVLTIERSNQTLKECVCSGFHALPNTAIQADDYSLGPGKHQETELVYSERMGVCSL